MKVATKTIFVTADGTEFADEKEATVHETAVLREAPWLIVAEATAEEIRDAIEGENPTVAAAIEAVAYAVATARRARGDLKRRPRAKMDETADEPATASEAA